MMRRLVGLTALVLALTLLTQPSAGLAIEKTMQNDTVDGMSGVGVSGKMTTGEGVAARFRPAADQYPVIIKAVQVMMVDDPTNLGTECGSYSVKIYQDDGPGVDPSMPPLLDTMLQDISFDISGQEGALQEIDIQSFGTIGVSEGGFRVEFHAEMNQCSLSLGNDHYPVPAVDESIQADTNFIWSGFGTSNIRWEDAQGLGVSGDFVIRVVVDVPTVCEPNCNGKDCGSDGCNGTCGSCAGDEVCASGLCCSPDCQGRDCGSDSCGGSCGVCGAGEVCAADGLCDCVPDCDGRECGDDGCGGDCGACEGCEGEELDPDTYCYDGVCAAVCCPDCEGRECGDDGCGGACGICDEGELCMQGACEPETAEASPEPVPEPVPEIIEETSVDTAGEDGGAEDTSDQDAQGDAGAGGLTVSSVLPAEGVNNVDTDIIIIGSGFEAGVTARLDADHLIVTGVDNTEIEATVPIGLAEGLKTLIVKNPDGSIATLDAAFTVKAPRLDVANSGSSGCTVAGGSSHEAPFLLGLLLAALLLCRATRVSPRRARQD